MAKFAVIIPAAGKSTRMGEDKLNINLYGKTVLERSIEAFSSFDQVIVVGRDVAGGAERVDSVYNGIKALNSDIDFVLIHDGARPFVDTKIIDNVKEALLKGAKSVVPCVSPKNTIRTKESTLDRSKLYEVQTPQGFEKKTLCECFEKYQKERFTATDDASIVEHYGVETVIVEGSYENIKITTPDDLPSKIRFGNGYDLHKLVEGRELWLGCIKIPFEKGLLGHSDADVLTHAICDAILGACALGDIGRHYPDTDPACEGISGKNLLLGVKKIVEDEGFKVLSVDGTLIAQRPKIAPHADKMRLEIANILGIDISKVSIKATTEEGLGPTGKGEAMAAYATAVVKEK